MLLGLRFNGKRGLVSNLFWKSHSEPCRYSYRNPLRRAAAATHRKNIIRNKSQVLCKRILLLWNIL